MSQKLLAAAGCLVCAVVGLRSVLAFDGTEFGGGTLARNQVLAALLCLLALILTFKYPRVAAVSALIACYFPLPLYLVFPRPFREVWPEKWAAPGMPRETFVWNRWWITGILVTIFLATICVFRLIRSLTVRSPAAVRA